MNYVGILQNMKHVLTKSLHPKRDCTLIYNHHIGFNWYRDEIKREIHISTYMHNITATQLLLPWSIEL